MNTELTYLLEELDNWDEDKPIHKYEKKINDFCLQGMIKFIRNYGFNAFKDSVYHGAFSEYYNFYIHPSDEMKATEEFELIQKAFFNAYV